MFGHCIKIDKKRSMAKNSTIFEFFHLKHVKKFPVLRGCRKTAKTYQPNFFSMKNMGSQGLVFHYLRLQNNEGSRKK